MRKVNANKIEGIMIDEVELVAVILKNYREKY